MFKDLQKLVQQSQQEQECNSNKEFEQALDLLLIINKSLGYNIVSKLVQFSYISYTFHRTWHLFLYQIPTIIHFGELLFELIDIVKKERCQLLPDKKEKGLF